MIEILTWITVISGGLLITLMVLSLLGGLDLDIDIDLGGDTDVDAGGGTDAGGGLGVLKSVLTFISIGSWVFKVVLLSNMNPILAVVISAASGAMAVFILSFLLSLLLRNQSNVNWSPEDALFKEGKVYLRISDKSNSGGIVQVTLNGAVRELKAKSDGGEIATGEMVYIRDYVDGYVIVEKLAQS